ncbi:MAG: YigZ family protein [Tindallia sp. MSAO_Bac2]|nr:MAG: YigZ family protein [Tindallia sp. MSAO_Bac2]
MNLKDNNKAAQNGNREFLTISQKQIYKSIIEKSEFIAIVTPVDEESEINKVLDDVRQNYPNASHYVYAYTIGQNQEAQKYSDDGEPSGTGGLPILEIFRNRGICNIMVVVVRYFGGTKLGTGGLKRAYSRTALEAIERAIIVKKKMHQWLNVKVDYSSWGKIEYYLEQNSFSIFKTQFTDEVSFLIPVLLSEEGPIISKLTEIAGGSIHISRLDCEYLIDNDCD